MNKATANGFIEKGILHILNRKRFDADIKAFKDMDVQVIIKKRGKRSTQANRYYWGVIIEEIRLNLLDRGIRETPEQIHEALKLKFAPERVTDFTTGEILLEVGGHTSEMNKDEYNNYLSQIIEWAAKSLEICIPEPSHQTELFNNEK